MVKPVLLLHGGAGTWKAPRSRIEKAIKAIRDAAEHGYRYLVTGSSVEAVVESIAYMEDSQAFNAGIGSVLNVLGEREMDAGIMDGLTGKAGAVATVKYPKNPIRLARIVMEKTGHVILAGEGADRLAEKVGLKEIPPVPEEVKKRYSELIGKYSRGELGYFKNNIPLLKEIGWLDTVGAVAIDSNRRLVAGVSTGGVWLKLPGRVGDSPVPGAGFYADKDIAVAATGIGEAMLLTMPGLRIALLVKQGYGFKYSMDIVLNYITSTIGEGTTGIIGIDKEGRHHISFNTRHILVSYKSPDTIWAKLMERKTS
ncbi:MAG: isoaspartyl peptidase/L-asparaginase [Desulfurococcales archaeon]|nr:isoaspartyl peptidase/L-asparaginase [Desulfurococcales archaeon]